VSPAARTTQPREIAKTRFRVRLQRHNAMHTRQGRVPHAWLGIHRLPHHMTCNTSHSRSPEKHKMRVRTSQHSVDHMFTRSQTIAHTWYTRRLQRVQAPLTLSRALTIHTLSASDAPAAVMLPSRARRGKRAWCGSAPQPRPATHQGIRISSHK